MLIAVFAVAAVVSLLSSAVLVSRLEKVGERLGATEALLGLIAALAADAPEITSAVAAIAGGHSAEGLGVTLGSNVFNLTARPECPDSTPRATVCDGSCNNCQRSEQVARATAGDPFETLT
jgi:hypothetical protein